MKTEIIYGRNVIAELLRKPAFDYILNEDPKAVITEIVFKKSLDDSSDKRLKFITQQAKALSIPLSYKNLNEFPKFIGDEAHGGVYASVKHIRNTFESLKAYHTYTNKAISQKQILLALDQINDPQNLGSIIRSAAFFGINAILLPKAHTPPMNTTLVKSSSGLLYHVNIVMISNLHQAILELKNNEYWVVGASMVAETSVSEYSLGAKTLLVIGSEGQGLRSLTEKSCDEVLKIPSNYAVDSLNIGTATSIFLYEFDKKRR